MLSTKELLFGKIKTYFLMSFVFFAIFLYLFFKFEFSLFLLMMAIDLAIVFFIVIVYVAYFIIKFKAYRIGFSEAFLLKKIIANIEKELLDANIYFHLRNDNEMKIVRLPRVSFFFENEEIRLCIENSVKYQNKLEKLDLSAALFQYVVESFYMNDKQSKFIYEIEKSDIKRRITYHSLDEIRESIDSSYQIKVDEKLSYKLIHGLFVGNTGSGKSYYLYYLVICGLIKKWNLYIIDPKNASMAKIGRKIDSVGFDRESIGIILRNYYNAMQGRKNELQELLERGLELDYSDFGLMPHVLIFDEFATFKSSLKNYDKKERDEISSMIDEIILQGRQLGFFIQICMQKSDATILPTYIRNSLLFKVVLWNADDTTYQTTFEQSNIPPRKLEKGSGWYTLQGKANEPKRIDTPTLEFDIYKAIATLHGEE